jgi:hypothetical protein
LNVVKNDFPVKCFDFDDFAFIISCQIRINSFTSGMYRTFINI